MTKMKYLTQSILRMPKRRKNAHKGDFGRVLIIGGSEDFAGAPILAATAAKSVLRSGADIATFAAPAKVAWAANRYSPDIITTKYKGSYFTPKHLPQLIRQAKNFDVIMIGCGMGIKKPTVQFIQRFIKEMARLGKYMVVDADAIKASRLQDLKKTIVTPHRTELKILLKNSRLDEEDIQKELGDNVILLKGPVDKIMSKGRTAYNSTHNPVMTKGGTGDVLAGLCAGFLAQTKDLFRSACMAAYLNGKVGNYLLKRRGRTFIASDIVENIHKVFR